MTTEVKSYGLLYLPLYQEHHKVVYSIVSHEYSPDTNTITYKRTNNTFGMLNMANIVDWRVSDAN